MSKWIVPIATTTERSAITPDEGEILYDETEEKYYGGDGSTVGGIEIASEETTVSVDGTEVSNPNLIFNENLEATVSGSDVTINATGGSGGSGAGSTLAFLDGGTSPTAIGSLITFGTTGNELDTGFSLNAAATTLTITNAGRYKFTVDGNFTHTNTTVAATFSIRVDGTAIESHIAPLVLTGSVSFFDVVNIDAGAEVTVFISTSSSQTSASSSGVQLLVELADTATGGGGTTSIVVATTQAELEAAEVVGNIIFIGATGLMGNVLAGPLFGTGGIFTISAIDTVANTISFSGTSSSDFVDIDLTDNSLFLGDALSTSTVDLDFQFRSDSTFTGGVGTSTKTITILTTGDFGRIVNATNFPTGSSFFVTQRSENLTDKAWYGFTGAELEIFTTT